MRTRRSPRNQERLWRALGGEAPAKPAARDRVAVVEEMLLREDLGPKLRRQLERELQREKIKRARRGP